MNYGMFGKRGWRSTYSLAFISEEDRRYRELWKQRQRTCLVVPDGIRCTLMINRPSAEELEELKSKLLCELDKLLM